MSRFEEILWLDVGVEATCRCVANCVAHATQSRSYRKHVQTRYNEGNEGAGILITLAGLVVIEASPPRYNFIADYIL